MKVISFFCSTCFVLFSAIGQEKVNDSVIKYVFTDVYNYRVLERDTTYLEVQFKTDVLKLVYSAQNRLEYVLIDEINELVATEFGYKPDIKTFSDLDKKEKVLEKGHELTKVDSAFYGDYDCNVYELKGGNKVLLLYFEKEPSTNFNVLLNRIISILGMNVSMENFPKGRLIAGVELKDDEKKDIIELIEIKENQHINFTLKTNI